jgi:hypothetical protein
MDYEKLTEKTKTLTLTVIDAQEKAFKSTVNAFEKFLGAESATYMQGLTKVAEEVTKNARKIVEDSKGFAYAGNTK